VAAAVLTGCTSKVGADAGTVTVAFLRAVPSTDGVTPLLEELRAAGYVQGRSLRVLAGDPDEVYPDPAEAETVVREWVADGTDLIVAMSSSGAMAARDAAPDVNVLFLSNDPLATGLVRDERRPEGRLTGATYRVPSDRTLTLLRRLIPDARRIGLPLPAGDPAGAAHRDAVADAAAQLGIELVVDEFSDADDAGRSVVRLAERGVDAVMLSSSPAAIMAYPQTQAALARHDLPAIANTGVADFAVLSLYPDLEVLQRQMGRMAARLLSGSSPSAVPVEDPRRFLVRVNAGAAAALGITVPAEVQREADEVLEP
jgi:putative tryptophan/tyrosine transport system substrate-binding protein